MARRRETRTRAGRMKSGQGQKVGMKRRSSDKERAGSGQPVDGGGLQIILIAHPSILDFSAESFPWCQLYFIARGWGWTGPRENDDGPLPSSPPSPPPLPGGTPSWTIDMLWPLQFSAL